MTEQDPSTTEPADTASPTEPTDAADTSWGRAWAWVPSLYFVQGLPYVVVNNLSVVLYKTLEVSNAQITFWTSWLSLAWALKALWSPFVDGVSTKRRWTLAMQASMVPALVLIAFALPMPWFLEATLALFLLIALASATHDIAADGLYMLGLRQDQQAAFVGVRSTFWRIALVSGEGGLVVLAGVLGDRMGVVEGWSTTLLVTAGIFAVATAWHLMILPVAPDDQPRPREEAMGNTAEIVSSFFQKEGIVAAILFIVFFRFGETHMAKLVSPFLLDDPALGGLGLTLAEVGFAKGTVGVLALVAGGILGGLAIYRDGLRAWIWPMVVALNGPDLLYVYMAWVQPQDYTLICGLIGVESFGYGFGFTAYMMFMIRIAEGKFKTAHYAFGTGLMALAVWASQFWSGSVQEVLGYDWFFVWVLVLTLPGAFVTWLVDIPPEFGKRPADAD